MKLLGLVITASMILLANAAKAGNSATGIQAAPTAPAPPEETPAVPCRFGPFIIFFEWDSAQLTAETRAILDQAIHAHANCNGGRFQIEGHTDRSGNREYNLVLADARANAVADYLAAQGIERRLMWRESFGEERLRIPTQDGVREGENRRVEIWAR